ncbi:hypothetical protein MASR2M52_13040 [Pedobacter sp.]
MFSNAYAQQIIGFDFVESTGQEETVDAKINDANLQKSVLTKGKGIKKTGKVLRTFGGVFSEKASKQQALASNEYLEFKVQAKDGFQVSLTSLKAKIRRNGSGPNSYVWMYSLDGSDFKEIAGTETTLAGDEPSGTAQPNIKLATIKELQAVPSSKAITFRIYAWGASSAMGSFTFGKSPSTHEEGKTTLFVVGKVEAK